MDDISRLKKNIALIQPNLFSEWGILEKAFFAFKFLISRLEKYAIIK